MNIMNWTIKEDPANLVAGVSLEVPEAFMPLSCLFFEASPARYFELLDAIRHRKGFYTENSGLRFPGDMDWEDEAEGIRCGPEEAYIFNHIFGGCVAPFDMIVRSAEGYFRKFIEVQGHRGLHDPSFLAELARRLGA